VNLLRILLLGEPLMLILVLTVFSLILTLIATATLVWMMHAWRRPDTYQRIWFAPAGDQVHHGFSLIVPCREEPEEVMRPTVEALLAQTHPDLEVIISVGDDDESTLATALLLAAEDQRVSVSVNDDPVKNKPRQLNTALRLCTKDVVGIIDAESLTKPDLLIRVDATMEAENADVVQGAVHLMNFGDSWFALHNCLEYRAWFRSRLHGHAESGFIPLGGNTVFTKRSVIEDVGGWDGDCLAEDCEIGVRLSSRHRKIVCAYDPDLVTEEQAPSSVKALVKQRTRWSLGFMQVLQKGEWKALPRNRRIAAWMTLIQQHAMALAGLAFPVALITALLVEMPVTATMVAFLPLVPMVTMIAFQCMILQEFGRDMNMPVPLRKYLVLIATTPLYQVLLGWAAVRAVYKYLTGDFGWYKTPHQAHAAERVAQHLGVVAGIGGRSIGGLALATAGDTATIHRSSAAVGPAPGGSVLAAADVAPDRSTPSTDILPPGRSRTLAQPEHRAEDRDPRDHFRVERLGGRGGQVTHRAAPSRTRGRWVVFGAVLAAVNLAQFPAFFDDEGTYYSQAWAIQALGQLSPYTYWYDHPPLGWIQLSAFTWFTDPMFTGSAALLSARVVMIGYGLATAVLVFVLGTRIGLRHGYAVLAMALWGLSPLVGLEMRQVFLDNVALPWLLGAFILVTSRRQDLWHYCAAGLCFGAAVLSKETFLIAAPALIATLWHYGYRPTRVFGVIGFSMLTVLAGSAYVLFALLKHELFPSVDQVSLWDALTFQLGERPGSGSILSAGSEANGYLAGWLAGDEVLIVGGLVAGLACLFWGRTRGIGLVIVLFTGMALRPGGYLPGMYVIVLLPFFAIALAAVLDRLYSLMVRSSTRRWQVVGASAMAVGLAVAGLAIAPDWAGKIAASTTARANVAHDEAMDWVEQQLPRDSLIVSDNTYWNDLVNAGWSPGWDGAVWFYKVDLDPAFVTAHPDGWRDIDYLIWNSTISGNSNSIPLTRAAYENSVLLETFGEGADAVEIREVRSS
jgi:cellulose synthase/poly-beta-1,6-N-acetylglucosamine synthase-like glycosyltransferase